ncbi:unnamed protein product [Rotaria socialis]
MSGKRCTNAADFTRLIQARDTPIIIEELLTTDIEDAAENLKFLFENVKAVPNIQKLHSITVLKTNEIECKVYSNIQPKVEAQEPVNDQSCVIGQDTQISWKFSGIGKPGVKWLFNNKPLPTNGRFKIADTEDGTSTLSIRQAERADQGIYTAVATNSAGEAEARTTLSIIIKPVIIVNLSGSLQIIKAETMTLRITAIGTPKPGIVWMKGNNKIKPIDRIHETTQNQYDDYIYTLEIVNLQPEDEGEYSATISNIGGSLQSNRCKITVSINTPANATWKQNGVTIAGGNGEGDATNQLYRPYGLFVDDDQTVVIADAENHRIVQWKNGDTTNGQVVAGGKGAGNGLHQLNQPTDVLIDKETDSLIICDFVNQRVVRWSRRSGTTQGEILIDNIKCNGVAMDEQRYLYVSDVGKHEVRRYQLGEKNGTLVAGGNDKGDGLNQLNFPTYLFVDRQQNVYVSDNENHRVMKWVEGSKEGIVVAGGQGQGSALTQLYYPRGIFVDTLGTLYVADTLNHRVMHWTQGDKKQGTVIVGGNGEGKGANQFNGPVGLSFDRQGNLYVVDFNNNRVQRFSIE